MMRREYFYYILFFIILAFGLSGIILMTDKILRTAVGSSSMIMSTYIFLKIIVELPSFQKFSSPIFSSLGYLFRSAELESIRYKIEGNLNDFRQKINNEYPNLIPETKLEWVKHENEETFHRDYDGKLLLKLHPSQDNTKNFIKATIMQVSKGAITESRIYVDEKINTSIDLTLTNKIIKDQDRHSFLYFQSEVLVPKLSDKQLVEYFRCMEILDEEGLFTRLFLRELKQLSNRRGLELTNLPEIRNDTRNFLDFADTIARKKRGIDVVLDYEGTHIYTGIVMVARPRYFEKYGVHRYVDRALEKWENGCEIVYIIGWEPTIRQTESVISYLIMNHDKEAIKDSIKWYFVGKDRRLCVAMRNKDASD